jgi:hypothetical protein
MGGQPVQPPLQSNQGQPVQQPNPYQPTYGDMAFGSTRLPPNSTYKIARLIIGCRKICMVGDIMRSWIMVL